MAIKCENFMCDSYAGSINDGCNRLGFIRRCPIRKKYNRILNAFKIGNNHHFFFIWDKERANAK